MSPFLNQRVVFLSGIRALESGASRARALATIGVIALGGLLQGCDGGTDLSPVGEVRGIVTIEGRGFAGAEVELSGPAREVTVTDDGGRYAFTDVPAGAYVVTVRGTPADASFSSTSRTAVISREVGSRLVTVDFVGSFIRTAAVQGRVLSGERGIAAVTVRAEGPDTLTTATDASGRYSFTGLRAGSYVLRISGFPATVTFPSEQGLVQVSAGSTVEFDFEGDPELTATAVITTLSRRLPSGDRETVDPGNLRGRIEVDVLVDRGQETPERVDLYLGATLVGQQQFNPDSGAGQLDGSAGIPGPPASTPFTLTFGIDTDEFNPETGVVRFQNGQRLLQVRLSTREGGEAVWTSSIQVTLQNVDTFVGTLEPQRGPVAGADGLEWVGGNIGVRVIPVVFAPGRTVTSLSVELRRTGGALLREREVAGESPILVVFPGTGSPSGANVAGYQTPLGAVDELRVRSARYADGSGVGGLPVRIVDNLRIDNVPPPGGTFVLLTQGAENDCCLGNWIGAAYAFAAGFSGETDAGVGGVSATYHAGPAQLTDAELAATPPVSTGAALAESPTNGAYRAVAVYRDALDNRRVIPLGPSDGNPLTNERGGVFGVDRTPPDVRFGSTSVPDRAVNPSSGSGWVVRAEDRESGFSSLPARTTLRFIAPGIDGVAACPFPGTGICQPAPDPLVRAVPETGQGYFLYRTRVLDRAGNRSSELQSWVLRDTSVPQIEGIERPPAPEAGSTILLRAPVSDNVDLHRAVFGLRFASRGDLAGFVLPFSRPDTLGTPFDGSPVGAVTARAEVTTVSAVEIAGGGPGDALPSGVLHPLEGVSVRVTDAAGNAAMLARDMVANVESDPASFSVAARGEEGGVRRWQASAQGSAVCALRPQLPEGGSCASAPLHLTLDATVRGRGELFGRPFERVHFYAVVAGDFRWLGSSTSGAIVEDGPGPEGRAWGWSLEWIPEVDFPAGSHAIAVVGVDESGTALRTPLLDGVTVVGASGGG